MRTVIRGTGMYVPDHIVDNKRLSRVMDTSEQWIVQRTGIETRRFADDGQATSDLAVPAARAALDDAGVTLDEIDYVVFATMTPDHYFPGSGGLMQHKLGMPAVPCLDIRQQCAGFLFGMQVADSILRSGSAGTLLLVGAEVHDGFFPWDWDLVLDRTDREVTPEEYEWNTRFRDRTVLFGDGAGAMVLGTTGDGDRGLIDVRVRTDGALMDKMWVDGFGSAYRPYVTQEMIDSGATMPIVVGREVFRTAVTLMPESVLEILDANGYGVDDLDLLIMHQANLRINEAVQKRLGLPDDKVFNNITKYGNTTAATLPMAYHEACLERDVPAGSLVCFVALGSGLNWGAALYRR